MISQELVDAQPVVSKLKILCVGGPLDGKLVKDVGNSLRSPFFGKPFVQYKKKTVSNDNEVFTIYYHRSDDKGSLLHCLVHGYRGITNE
jgi:hypothetical protein